MRMEQVFTEPDLEELYQVLSKSLKPKKRITQYWIEHKKTYLCCLIVGATILFVTCAFLVTRIRWFAIAIAIFGVLTLFYAYAWSKMIDKLLNPEKIVQKYSEPFVVAVEDNTLHFRESDFAISSIDHIVEYKYFLFIRANKKWCFIKTEEREKAMILSELNNDSNITFTKIEEPVDLRQFR